MSPNAVLLNQYISPLSRLVHCLLSLHLPSSVLNLDYRSCLGSDRETSGSSDGTVRGKAATCGRHTCNLCSSGVSHSDGGSCIRCTIGAHWDCLSLKTKSSPTAPNGTIVYPDSVTGKSFICRREGAPGQRKIGFPTFKTGLDVSSVVVTSDREVRRLDILNGVHVSMVLMESERMLP